MTEREQMWEKVERFAEAAHEINRIYREGAGEDPGASWELASVETRESCREGVRKILSGEVATPEQSHESWMRRKQADGWTYGLQEDPSAKTHPCLVPWGQLPKSQQIKDHLFFGVVTGLMLAGEGR